MRTKRRTQLIIVVLIVIFYGSSISLLKGKLPNQTATIVTVEKSQFLSLMPRQNMAYTNLTLESEAWEVEGENVKANDLNGTLIVSGTYGNKSLYSNKVSPLFKAKLLDLELNFTNEPYIHAVISSKPNTEICFLIGWYNPNPVAIMHFFEKYPEVTADIDITLRTVWINVSYPHSGEKLDDQAHSITMNVAKRLTELKIEKETFIGIQIWQYVIDSSPQNEEYETRIETLCLLNKPQYIVTEEGEAGRTLQDRSVVYIVKNASFEMAIRDCPYLQRTFVLYGMDAPMDTMYTIFLLTKNHNDLIVVRAGFVFVHKSLLNEVGTYIDWRGPVWLDYDFEPIATLYSEMEKGDYAIVFTPLRNNEFNIVEMKRASFTFSKLPYSAFVVVHINEEELAIMSSLILTIAGVIPTALVLVLYYKHRRKTLPNDNRAIKKILLTGLILRLILAPISGYADDTQVFSQLGSLYFGSGILGAQWVSFPGFVYLETAAYFPYALLRTIGFQDYQFLALNIYCVELLFTKIPSILSDVGAFYFILKIANKFTPDRRVFVAGLYLLNPLMVYMSGILGQFDSIFTFALLAYTYYLIVESNLLKASMFSVFAAVLNPVGLATFIPLTVVLLLNKNWRTTTKSALLISGIFVITMVPFLFEPDSPMVVASIERIISAVPGESFYGRIISFYAYGTNIGFKIGYGLTFRFLLELFDYELGWWFYPFGAALAFLFFVSAFIYKLNKTIKMKLDPTIYIGTFMLGIVCLFQFFFFTIYEQFVVWVAGLLLVFYILKPNIKVFFLFTITCISAGFIYVATWRSYLLLVSGVPVSHFGDVWLSDFGNAMLGVAYSLMLIVGLTILLKVWFKEEIVKIKNLFVKKTARSNLEIKGI